MSSLTCDQAIFFFFFGGGKKNYQKKSPDPRLGPVYMKTQAKAQRNEILFVDNRPFVAKTAV